MDGVKTLLRVLEQHQEDEELAESALITLAAFATHGPPALASFVRVVYMVC